MESRTSDSKARKDHRSKGKRRSSQRQNCKRMFDRSSVWPSSDMYFSHQRRSTVGGPRPEFAFSSILSLQRTASLCGHTGWYPRYSHSHYHFLCCSSSCTLVSLGIPMLILVSPFSPAFSNRLCQHRELVPLRHLVDHWE